VLLVCFVWSRLPDSDDDDDSDDGDNGGGAHMKQRDQTVDNDERVADKKKNRNTTSMNAPSDQYVMTFD